MRQKILMCPPDYFNIDYVINPWMENNQGKAEPGLALAQWRNLCAAIEPLADIALVPPQPGLPDLVFTANAGLVWRDIAVVSHFRLKERQGETPHFAAWFSANGFRLADWPKDISFEGAGDALFDREQNILWVGSGFRSDLRAANILEKILPHRIVRLGLANPSFYHLDTCLCPLGGGYLLYYPQAFDAESLRMIAEVVPPEKLIEVGEQDAFSFACNAVDLDGHIVMNDATPELRNKLRAAGFTPHLVPLGEFLKSGGTAKCLTLKLHEA
ncbi:MAG: arginine deiminase-related protein [Alphaproteobacteria bacterium]